MAIKNELLGDPLTKDYRPRPPMMSMGAGLAATSGGFWLQYVEEMRRDDQVAMVLGYRGEPLHGAKFDIQASTPRLRAFVDEQRDRFWRKSLATALECVAFGYTGSEALYMDPGKYLEFDALRPLHPLDVRPATVKGRLHSVVVRSGMSGGGWSGTARPAGENGGIQMFAATDQHPGRGVWFVHQATYSPWYGRSVLVPCWYPWRLKTMPDGAMETLFKWFYRHAFTGMEIHYPQNMYFSNSPNETGISAQDYAMQIAEQLKSGGPVGLPSDTDANGKPLWEIKQYAKIEGNADGLISYIEFLNKLIARGAGIPDEVLTQGETGSYAKSKVAAGAFYRSCEQLLNSILESFDRHILKGLVRLNFGKNAKYKIIALPLQQDAQMAQGQGGGPGPMVPGGVGPDAGGMEGMPQPEMDGGGDPNDPMATLLGEGQQEDGSFGGEEDDGGEEEGDPIEKLLGMNDDGGEGEEEEWSLDNDPLKKLLGVRMSLTRDAMLSRKAAEVIAGHLNTGKVENSEQYLDEVCELLSDTPWHLSRNRFGRWVVIDVSKALQMEPIRMSGGVPQGWQPYVGKLKARKGQQGLRHEKTKRVVWAGTPEYERLVGGGKKAQPKTSRVMGVSEAEEAAWKDLAHTMPGSPSDDDAKRRIVEAKAAKIVRDFENDGNVPGYEATLDKLRKVTGEPKDVLMARLDTVVVKNLEDWASQRNWKTSGFTGSGFQNGLKYTMEYDEADALLERLVESGKVRRVEGGTYIWTSQKDELPQSKLGFPSWEDRQRRETEDHIMKTLGWSRGDMDAYYSQQSKVASELDKIWNGLGEWWEKEGSREWMKKATSLIDELPALGVNTAEFDNLMRTVKYSRGGGKALSGKLLHLFKEQGKRRAEMRRAREAERDYRNSQAKVLTRKPATPEELAEEGAKAAKLRAIPKSAVDNLYNAATKP